MMRWCLCLVVLIGLAGTAAAGLTSQGGAKVQARLASELKKVEGLLAQSRYAEAARAAERLVRRFKNEFLAWMALAHCHIQEWPLRNDQRAEEAAEQCVLLKGREPPVLLVLVKTKLRQSKFDEVLALVEELLPHPAIRSAPETTAELLTMRATVHQRQGALDPQALKKAAEDLELARTLSPRNVGVLISSAELHIHEQRYEEARVELEAAVAISPGQKRVHSLLVTCYRHKKDPEKVKLHYEILTLLNRLVDSVALTNAPKEEERFEILRKLAVKNPTDFEHRMQLAVVLWRRGESPAALKEIDEILKIAPIHQGARLLRAQVESGAGPDEEEGEEESEPGEDADKDGDSCP